MPFFAYRFNQHFGLDFLSTRPLLRFRVSCIPGWSSPFSVCRGEPSFGYLFIFTVQLWFGCASIRLSFNSHPSMRRNRVLKFSPPCCRFVFSFVSFRFLLYAKYLNSIAYLWYYDRQFPNVISSKVCFEYFWRVKLYQRRKLLQLEGEREREREAKELLIADNPFLMDPTMNDVHSRHSRIGHWNKLSSDLSIDHFRMCETQLRLFKCNYFPRLEREAQHQLQLRPVHKTFVNL